MLILNDISKETFYSESGISTANMTQWRAGDYNPSKKSIEKAERFFENRQKEKPTTPEGSELNLSDMELLSAFKQSDEATQELIRRVLGLK